MPGVGISPIPQPGRLNTLPIITGFDFIMAKIGNCIGSGCLAAIFYHTARSIEENCHFSAKMSLQSHPAFLARLLLN